MIHRLKTLPPYFEALLDGSKTCELRRNDRGFAAGHTLELVEWDGKTETGRQVERTITHVLAPSAAIRGLTNGFVVLSISDKAPTPEKPKTPRKTTKKK